MVWKGESRRHSLARRGIKTAKGVRHYGSQTREAIEDVRDPRQYIVLMSGDEVLTINSFGEYEVYVRNDDYAGYVLEIDGIGYEFVHSVPNNKLEEYNPRLFRLQEYENILSELKKEEKDLEDKLYNIGSRAYQPNQLMQLEDQLYGIRGEIEHYGYSRDLETKKLGGDEFHAKGIKQFNEKHNVGSAKYVINYHDGSKKHPDGSDFFDIAIFKNKKNFEKFKNELRNKGYKEGGRY